MIPKIIHYCWFGGKDLPESVQKCIDSWKKFAPDYELKLWNESNYDVNQLAYTKEAYEAGKYAFVTDVVRLDVVAQHGGIYLDTDVELIKPMDQLLLNEAGMAFEQKGRVATGLGFGAVKNHPVILENLEAYKDRHFMVNGVMDTTTCVTITMDTLKELVEPIGIPLNDIDKTLMIDELNLTLLATQVMCPYSLETGKLTITPNTISIHHYDATWKPHKDHLLKFKIKARRFIGDKRYEKLKAFLSK